MKILQFGEGNFLRAFVDYMIDVANENGVMDASVTIAKPIAAGDLSKLLAQDCKYTLLTRGKQKGETIENTRRINSVSDAICCYNDFNKLLDVACDDELKLIVSNTTEAGITMDDEDNFGDTPPKSYPAKLTRILYARFEKFCGNADKGIYILPCELIEKNGEALEKCVLETAKKWNLSDEFISWVNSSCYFCTTLVDRIVTGYNKELSEQYGDPMLDICEPFALWVIEDKGNIRDVFPLDKAGLPVVFTSDVSPYRERKVRILNGAHTSTVLAAYLAGKSIVRECMQDDVICGFMKSCLFDEIIPTLKLEKQELYDFANEVFERFANPFIDHSLLSISLNSVSKFKARLLGSFRDYYEITGKIPRRITFSFAALIAFYTKTDKANDSAAALEFFAENKDAADLIEKTCKKADFWGEDLSKYPNFCETVQKDYQNICTIGAYEAMKCL